MLNIENVLVLMLPSILYASAGAIQGNNQGEAFDPVSFAKTLIAGAVTAGLVSTTQAAELTQMATSTVFTYVIDKLINAVLKRFKKPAPPVLPSIAPPTVATPATTMQPFLQTTASFTNPSCIVHVAGALSGTSNITIPWNFS